MRIGEPIVLDELNAAVQSVAGIERVSFVDAVSEDAIKWLRKKHADGAVHEPATIAAFLAISKRFKCRKIFDLGASFGYFSILCSSLFSDAEITAFETHPKAFEDLKLNCPDVTCVYAAISDVTMGDVRIWISGWNIFERPIRGWGEGHPDMFRSRGKGNRGRGEAVVNFLTLDDYCKEFGVYPDLIKIDVEGYQTKAIRGSMGVLQKASPIVIIELHDQHRLERMSTTNKATVQPLLDMGYRGYWCGNHRSTAALFQPFEWMGDIEVLSLAVFVPS